MGFGLPKIANNAGFAIAGPEVYADSGYE